MATNAKGQPICNATIEGPKYGRIVAWRKQCQRVVRTEGDRCHQHGGRQTA